MSAFRPSRRVYLAGAVFIGIVGCSLTLGLWPGRPVPTQDPIPTTPPASLGHADQPDARPAAAQDSAWDADRVATTTQDDDLRADAPEQGSRELRTWLPAAKIESCERHATGDEANAHEKVDVEEAIVRLPDMERPVAVRQVIAQDGDAARVVHREAFVADRVLVKLQRPEAVADLRRLAEAHGASIERRVGRLGGDLYAVRLQRRGHAAVKQAVKHFSDAAAGLAYAEPDHVYFAIGDGIAPEATTPDDPDLSECWGLHNTGQTGGTADADIDAPEAWDLATGSHDVVVAVIDTGIDYTHPDLAANMWTNPGEIPGNNIDDDDNGYVDDVYGWNFVDNTSDPMDDHLHGTHCAGTIGAVGNDGNGISGVCWSVKLMALKFLSAGGSGTASGAVSAVEYATENGAHVMSNSWGGGAASQALEDVITAANDADALFVAAAGNSGSNNDDTAHFPSSYEVPNVVSVAANDHDDAPASFSCYGLESVDLFAPGVAIYSTYPTYMTDAMSDRGDDTHYETISGTSMATPHVAGAAALLMSVTGKLSPTIVKAMLMESVDKVDAYSGLVASEGRLNVATMLQQVSDSWLLMPINPKWNDGPNDPAVGNNNGFAEAGETLALSIDVANIGLDDTAGAAQLRVTSNDSYVTIANGTVDLGVVAGLDRRTIDGITLALAPDTPAGHVINCTLQLREDGTTVDTADLTITVYALGTISGYVLDNQSAGVSGVKVQTAASADIHFSTYTDGDGHYVIPVIEGLPMEIKAVKRNWFPDAERFTAPCDAIDLHVYPLDIRVIDKGRPFALDRFGHVSYEVDHPARTSSSAAWTSIRETCEGDRVLPFGSDGGFIHANDLLSIWAPRYPAVDIWRDGVMCQTGDGVRGYLFTNDETVYGFTYKDDNISYAARWNPVDGHEFLYDTASSVYAVDDVGNYYGTVRSDGDIKPWIGNESGDVLLDLPEPGFADAGAIWGASSDGTRICGIMYRDEKVTAKSAVGFYGTPEGVTRCNYPIDYESGDDHWSKALHTNGQGLVGGWYYHITHNSQTRVAAVYRGGSWIDLNEIMPANSGWVLQEVVGMNESGDLLCLAQLRFEHNFTSYPIYVTVVISPRDVPNRTPLVDAGRDQRVLLDLGGELHAQANDDGDVAPTYLWEQISGPGTATITAPDQRVTAVTYPAAGTYAFRFSAVDADGASAQDEVSVAVVDEANEAPTIAITTPADGTEFAQGTYMRRATGEFAVTTADADGDVVRVEYFVDGQSARMTTIAPFDTSLTFGRGTFSVMARAYDDDGAYTDSDPIEILVDSRKPSVEILYPTGDVPMGFGETIVARFRITKGDTKLNQVSVYIDTDEYVQWYPPADEVLEIPLEGLDTGMHCLRVNLISWEEGANVEYGQDAVIFEIVRPPFITAPGELKDMQVDTHRGLAFEAFGSVPLTWSVASGDVPPGMSLDAESGGFAGSVSRAGRWTFTVQAENIHGSHQRTFTQTVLRPLPRTITVTVPDTDWMIAPEDGLPVEEDGDDRIFDHVDPEVDHTLTPTPVQPSGNG